MKIQNESYNQFKKTLLAGRPGLRAIYAKSQAKYDLVCKMIDARLDKGLTQAQLARKIGTKQAVISRFESGVANPTYEFLQNMARALDRKLLIDLPSAI